LKTLKNCNKFFIMDDYISKNETFDTTDRSIGKKHHRPHPTALSEKLRKISNKYGNLIESRDVLITDSDFENLSRSEKSTLQLIGNIYGIMTESADHITFSQMKTIMDKFTESRDNISKDYIMV